MVVVMLVVMVAYLVCFRRSVRSKEMEGRRCTWVGVRVGDSGLGIGQGTQGWADDREEAACRGTHRADHELGQGLPGTLRPPLAHLQEGVEPGQVVR